MSNINEPIRRQMPEDHDPKTCSICKFLAEPCPKCDEMHADYEEAASCMQTNVDAYWQYYKAMRKDDPQ